MVVADALSRAVSTIDTSELAETTDAWYKKLRQDVVFEPDCFLQYKVENNALFKHCSYNSHQMSHPSWRLVVPIEKRADVLKLCHDDPLSAHGGRHKTIDRVSREYYWPKMYGSITAYVRNCEVCRASKSSNMVQRAPMGDRINVNRPWQALYVDFVGPFPRSKNGFVYIFVVVDAFSKFVHILPMRVATAKGIIKFLENNIFLVFGVPDQIISDNGSQFISREYQNFLGSYNVHTYSQNSMRNEYFETHIKVYVTIFCQFRFPNVHFREQIGR